MTKIVKNKGAAPAEKPAEKPAASAAPAKKPSPKVGESKGTPVKKAKPAVEAKPAATEGEDGEVEVQPTGSLGRHDVALALRAKIKESGAALAESLAEAVVKGFEQVVQEAVSQGKEVNLPGFGKFGVTLRPARTGRNPQTNETIEIPAGYKVSFKAAKGLKDAAKSREIETA